MANEKQIKFTFAVDSRTLDQARMAIRQLTADVKALVETMGRAGGGGGLLGGVSGKSGPINTQRESIKVPGVSSISTAIAGDAKALAQVARTGSLALDSLTRSMKGNFSGQVSEIERLKRELAGLEGQYKKLQGMATLPNGNVSSRTQSAMVENELQRSNIQAHIAGHMARRQQIDEENQLDTSAQQPGPPWSKRASKFLWGDRPQGMWGRIAQMSEENVGWGGTQGLGVLGTAGLVAAMAKAAFSVGSSLTQSISGTARDAATAQLNFDVKQPLLRTEQQARVGGVFQGMGLELQKGNAARAIAIEDALKSEAIRSYFSQHNQEKIRELILRETGTDQSSATLLDQGSELLKKKTASLMAGTDTDVKLQGEYDAAMRRAMLQPENAEMFQKVVGQVEAANTMRQAMVNEAYQGAPGVASLLRQSGIGGQGGRMVPASNFPGLTYDPNIAISESRAALAAKAGKYMGNYGYSLEQGIALESEYGGVGGRGEKGYGPSLNVAREGGLGNAFQLHAASRIYGGGGFYGAVQRGIGGRGADITAGGNIASLIAEQMMGGGYRGTGVGAATELLGWASKQGTGFNTPASMRMSNIIGKGFGAGSAALGGGYSPLQEALFWANANRSMPGNVYGGNEMAGMSWAERLDMERGTGDKHWNKLFGLNAGTARAMRESSAQSMYKEFHPSLAQGMDPEVIKAATTIANGGNIGTEFKRLKDLYGAGKKGKGANKRAVEDALETLGAGLSTGTKAERISTVLSLLGPQGFEGQGSGAGAGLDKTTREILKKKAEDSARDILSQGQGGEVAIGARLGELGGSLRGVNAAAGDVTEVFKHLSREAIRFGASMGWTPYSPKGPTIEQAGPKGK